MIFNGSNVKVIKENGYLNNYVNKIVKWFPFTEEDVKNNILILRDGEFIEGKIFYLMNYSNGIAHFFSLSASSVSVLTFNFNTMKISFSDKNWSN